MKTLKKQLKVVALFFSVLILFQGCLVYKSADVTLDEAAKANTWVKVTTTDDRVLDFKEVGVEGESYYGILKSRNKWVKTSINKDKIARIQIKDKPLSAVKTVAVPVAVFAYIIRGLSNIY